MLEHYLIMAVIGLVAGFLAGKFMRGGSLGLVGNLVVGIIGALIGGFLFGIAGIGTGNLAMQLVAATAGACLLLYLLKVLKL